jgi:hypothetical protein
VDEAGAGVVRLVAHDAIELGRVRDRLVHRQPQMRRQEDQVVAAGLNRLGRQLLYRLLGPARRVADQIRIADVLVAEPAPRQVPLMRLRFPPVSRKP